MANVPDLMAPTVTPQNSGGDRYQTMRATPEDFGSQQGAAAQELGRSLLQVGDFFGQVAADDAANQYQERVNKILYGDPQKQVMGPDGKMVQDTGYMGLKGRAALDARPAVVEQLDTLQRELKGYLKSPKSELQFDNMSRRYKIYTDAQIGQHAKTQELSWASSVNKASAKVALDDIAINADNEEKFLHATSDLINARVKQAQLEGGGPELVQEAVRSAQRDALATRLDVIGTTDPVRAMRMLEANKALAGSSYDNLYNRFKSRYDTEVGRGYADTVVGAHLPLANGADTLAMLRHFEGFIPNAKWDVNHHRVGYGADTVIRADGREEKVTENTVVSREDAERTLAVRAQRYQAQIRGTIGQEAWDKLDPRAQASLTSVAYNYGRLPDAVAAAARTGDPTKIAESIVGLAGDNKGVNRRRRMQEAANILNEKAPATDPAEVLRQIDNSDLTPAQKSAATAQATHLLKEQHNAQVQQRAEFESRVADTTAEALHTGGTANPVPLDDFVRQYGKSAGEVKYRDYQSNLQFAADRQAFETMSDEQIRSVIDTRMPEPGVPGYATRYQQVERLQKYAADLEKQRREDPAGAVSRSVPVKQAQEAYRAAPPEQKGEAFRKVVAARIAAQEALGIEKDYQAPITKAEAMKLTTPLSTMLPGQEDATIREVAKKFVDMFGDNAEQAFSYAMRARKMGVRESQIAGHLATKMARGEMIATSDAAEMDQAREMDAAERAMTSTSPRFRLPPPTPAKPRVIGNPDEMQDPFFGMTPRPEAIDALLARPELAAEFDKKFGAGSAKEIFKQFGPAVGGKGGGNGGG